MTAAPGRIDLGFCLVRAVEPSFAARKVREAGLDGVELWPAALGEGGVPAWRDALEAEGLRCLQVCPYFDFMGGPQSITRSAWELEEHVVAARALGCRRLRAFTGPAWGSDTVDSASATAGQWRDTIAGLRLLCDLAGDEIELCLECHENSLIEDSDSVLRILDGVSRPSLTVNLQLPLRDEDWRVSLDRLSPFTSQAHVHNYTGEFGRSDLTWLDAGTFDWEPVVETVVVGNGRDMCLSIEHADHGRGDDVWETAHRDGAFLRELRDRVLGGDAEHRRPPAPEPDEGALDFRASR
ncbi:sugar phosphate isomerase/epimerase family protein [Rathayibacter sp. CAU 1779]